MPSHLTNGKVITDDLFNQAKDVIRRGGKAFFVSADDINGVAWSDEHKKDMCPNCNGGGKVGLQIFTGGPYKSIPVDTRGATYPNGAWYRQKTRMDTCPICNGSGNRTMVKRPMKREVTL